MNLFISYLLVGLGFAVCQTLHRRKETGNVLVLILGALVDVLFWPWCAVLLHERAKDTYKPME